LNTITKIPADIKIAAEGGEAREARSQASSQDGAEGGETREARSQASSHDGAEGGETREARSQASSQDGAEGGEAREARSQASSQDGAEGGETREARSQASSHHKAEGMGASPNPQASGEAVRINEIFYSLQGESSRVGLPTVFVRLTGCPLRCGYCDTAYAFHDGITRPLTEILTEVASYETKRVCVTGGEPLAQRGCFALLRKLCDAGYSVSLETSGAVEVAEVDERVSCIVDMKTPGSGEVNKNLWKNLDHLNGADEVKFVLTGEDDYRWAADVLRERKIDRICPVLFSPSFGELSYEDLAAWILRDRLPVRMQVQLHKVIWGERRGV